MKMVTPGYSHTGAREMILNIFTFVSCLTMLFLFRRFDRSNHRMIKLRRYADKVSGDFRKTAEKESRRYNDATIEMDILVKKGNALASTLKDSITEVEARLKGLNVEKANLARVEDDLKIISNAAREVNRQIEFIGSARADFSDMTQKVSFLTGAVAQIERDTNSLTAAFADKIRERSREISEEIAVQFNTIKENIREKEIRLMNSSGEQIEEIASKFTAALSGMERRVTDTGDALLDAVRTKIDAISKTADTIELRVDASEKKVYSELAGRISGIEKAIQSFELDMMNTKEALVAEARGEVSALDGQMASISAGMSELETTIFNEIKTKSAEVKKDISSSLHDFTVMKETLADRIDEDIQKVYGKLKNVEENIDQSKSKLIASFEEEVNKIRTELDNLSIHSITKKDEIIKATRKEAEEIRSRIEDFNEKYHDMEHRIGEFEERFASSLEIKLEKAKNDINTMTERVSAIKQEIIEYEENQQIFTKSDEMIRQVSESVSRLNGILQQSREEARGLEKFMADVEKVKDLRKLVEREIKVFETRKEKMLGIEGEIRQVILKADSLDDKMVKIDQVNSRIDALAASYTSLEERISDLNEYEDSIMRSLDAAARTDVVMTSVDGRIKSLQKTLEKSDKRTEKLMQYLQSVEEKTLMLKTREKDITEVKDRFTELEGLSEHIEKKIDQIHAMFQKLDSMRSEVDKTDSRLKTMFDETERKMRQFADFMQAVDTNSPITKQVRGDIPIGKNMNEGTVKVVRELSKKGWSSDEISKKLMMDENSVRFIINTTSL